MTGCGNFLLEEQMENSSNDTPSDNCDLSELSVSEGVLSPAFDPAVTEYEVTVAHEVTSITVTGTAAEDGAVVGGQSAGAVALEVEVGENTVTVMR